MMHCVASEYNGISLVTATLDLSNESYSTPVVVSVNASHQQPVDVVVVSVAVLALVLIPLSLLVLVTICVRSECFLLLDSPFNVK